MSEKQTKVIFDEKIIEKYKKKIEMSRKFKASLVPILVTLIFVGAIVSYTVVRTKFAYLFRKEQNILYVKNNNLYLKDINSDNIVQVDDEYKIDNENLTQDNEFALKGSSVFDKVTNQLLYLKGFYKPSYERTGQFSSVGTLKIFNLDTSTSEILENDVIANSIYYNDKKSFCIFEQLTTERGSIKICKLDFKNNNEITEIANNVKMYYVYRESGNVIYYDSNKKLFLYDGETTEIDSNIESLSYGNFDNKSNIYVQQNNNQILADKIYYTKSSDYLFPSVWNPDDFVVSEDSDETEISDNIKKGMELFNKKELMKYTGRGSTYGLYEYDIAKKENKLLMTDVSDHINILADGTIYYTRDELEEVPYIDYIDVDASVNDIREPATMTRQNLEGIDFIVYKNNIYDSADVDKVEEVMSKYNDEFATYENKITRFNTFMQQMSAGNYYKINKSIYYFDGYHEYKLNDGDLIGNIQMFDEGVFFKLRKDFPIIKLKLISIVEGNESLDNIIDEYISKQKVFNYVYKRLDGATSPVLNFVHNQGSFYRFSDDKDNLIFGYTHYVGDQLFENLIKISSDLSLEDSTGVIDKYKIVGVVNNNTTELNEIIKYTKYPFSDLKTSRIKSLVDAEIGNDSEKKDIRLSNAVVMSNNDNLAGSKLYPFYANYDTQNNVGNLYLYNKITSRSTKMSDNVQAAIILSEREGLYLIKSKNGKIDLRYDKNVLDEDVTYILDLYGNDINENKIKHVVVDKNKKANDEEISNEEKIDYSLMATRSYLIAGRDYNEEEVLTEELPLMQVTGFQELDGMRMYNKGNLNYARNEWIDEGPFRYHFDGKGEMEVSKWIDDIYYVNHVGVMVKNSRTPDGYRVDQYGEFVDDEELKHQAKRLAEETTKKAREKQASSGTGKTSSSGSTSSSNSKPTTVQPNTGAVQNNRSTSISTTATEVESPSRKFYVSGYQVLQSYVPGDDNDCDIFINYPVISGEDPEEVAKINAAINDILDDIQIEAEGEVNAEAKLPTQYVINKAKVGNISASKITINLTGTMVRPPSGNKSVRLTITYDRDDEYAIVSS